MLFFTLEQIENALFETIRLKLITDGYLPNFTNFASSTLFQTALNARYLAGTNTVEVFNDSNYDVKGQMKYSRVVIKQMSIESGFGTPYQFDYNEDIANDNYKELAYPSSLQNLTYKIVYVTDSKTIDRYLQTMLVGLFGGIKKFKGMNSNATQTTDYFKTIQGRSFDVSDENEIEKGIEIRIPKVYINALTQIGTIGKMTDFIPTVTS